MGSKEGRVPGKDVPEVQKPLLDEGEAEAEGGEEGRGEGMIAFSISLDWITLILAIVALVLIIKVFK